MNANERQVGGDHYKVPPGIPEHWDIVVQNKLDYFQGQITKYVMRWKNKGGIRDLEKARHFLDKYIEVAQEGSAISANYFGDVEVPRMEAGRREEMAGKKVVSAPKKRNR